MPYSKRYLDTDLWWIIKSQVYYNEQSIIWHIKKYGTYGEMLYKPKVYIKYPLLPEKLFC